jgi:peroxiredoxin family protein
MKITGLLLVFLIFLNFKSYSQNIISCENVTTFPKSSTPDLGICIYSGDPETVWNALRLAVLSQSKGDTVVIFVLGKGLDVFNSKSKKFDIKTLSYKFMGNGGQILACATCAKLRKTENVQACTITSIIDLYEIVKRSKKVLTF